MTAGEEAEQYLSARGVLPETAKKHGVEIDSAPTMERLKDRLNQDFNGDCPEAVLWFDAGWSKDVASFVPTVYLARCFPPVTRYGKENKFLSPCGKPQQPYILPSSLELANRLNAPVIVTEGPSRALLLSQCGFCSVSLVGVWNAAERRSEEAKAKGEKLQLHPVLRQWMWMGREVLLGFDQDYLENQTVLHALIRNVVLFNAAGANVKVLTWNKDQGKGLDDYISKKAGLIVSDQTRVLGELVTCALSTVDFLLPHHVDLVFNELGRG